ncbi:MAG: MMPL family transporter [Proteobacteria bacterium]|nr:MMPL family transporter [Pseudomonadota bacterium]
MMRRFFNSYVLEYPRLVLVLIIVAVAILGYQSRKLEIDASAETLLLEDDKDLAMSRLFNERFRSQDFLIITFTPEGDLLAEKNLDIIRRLRADLVKLERVESVTSILDVPLLESPPKPVSELIKDVPTLESQGVDKALAKKEFLNSAIYKSNLVSADFKTTAILANLHDDKTWQDFVKQRNQLRDKEKTGTITEEEKKELAQVIADFKTHRDKVRDAEHENIAKVRAILESYRGESDLFLGGVTMIADDLITFVKSDLKVFGLGVLVFLVVMLWIIFRQLRWIILPILTCGFSVVTTSGLLGLFGWEVTVISSNFISIQLIITMAITIHLIVRYRELVINNPGSEQRELVLEAAYSMSKPCFFAILTTMAGFSSLVFSGIRPIINFGWMMTTGIGISLILTFLIFSSFVVLLEKTKPNTSFESFFSFTKKLAQYTEKYGKGILIFSGLVLLLSIVGAIQLKVENSFIDYFKKDTEIYQGMAVIDQKLGGTTPLDVVIDFSEEEENSEAETEEDDEFAEFDEFEEEFEAEKDAAQYWFTSYKMDQVEKVHDYLESVPEIGKTLSLGTMLKVGKILNDGQPLDNFLLALVYKELPERFRKIILNPYVSVENNQARFSVRIVDSLPELRRNELLKRIRHDLVNKVGIEDDKLYLAGMMVMYNNMLQSLFDSQIMTLGAVLAALMFMFMVLFRSLKIAFIAIFPNVLSVGFVLGFMGWAGIPLDMMTITIAAISVGIAVDDTIHYIHRFIREFEKDRNYIAAMHRCHQSIGYAMYYTSITIIIGFSILVLSNFIPTIYFGILTGLAMVIALLAALTLLPQLIVLIKPLGPEKSY